MRISSISLLLTLVSVAAHADSRFSATARGLFLEDARARESAAEQILKTPEWQAKAVELAKSKRQSDRLLAVAVLTVDTSDQKLAKAFTGLLSDRSPRVRAKAAEVVTLWRDNAHYSTMRATLFESFYKSRDNIEKFVVVSTIASEAASDSVELLIKASQDSTPEIREAAIHGLGNISALRESAAARAVERLLRIAQTGDVSDKYASLYYLKRSGGTEGRDLLSKIAAHDSEPAIRKLASDLLKGESL